VSDSNFAARTLRIDSISLRHLPFSVLLKPGSQPRWCLMIRKYGRIRKWKLPFKRPCNYSRKWAWTTNTVSPLYWRDFAAFHRGFSQGPETKQHQMYQKFTLSPKSSLHLFWGLTCAELESGQSIGSSGVPLVNHAAAWSHACLFYVYRLDALAISWPAPTEASHPVIPAFFPTFGISPSGSSLSHIDCTVPPLKRL